MPAAQILEGLDAIAEQRGRNSALAPPDSRPRAEELVPAQPLRADDAQQLSAEEAQQLRAKVMAANVEVDALTAEAAHLRSQLQVSAHACPAANRLSK